MRGELAIKMKTPRKLGTQLRPRSVFDAALHVLGALRPARQPVTMCMRRCSTRVHFQLTEAGPGNRAAHI